MPPYKIRRRILEEIWYKYNVPWRSTGAEEGARLPYTERRRRRWIQK
jgi:hypothetical protein